MVNLIQNDDENICIFDNSNIESNKQEEYNALKDNFILFCKGMGLDDKQIDVILNSNFKEQQIDDVFDTEKYKREDKPTKTTLPEWKDIAYDTFENFVETRHNLENITENEYNILKDFRKDLEAHNLSMEQFLALNLYTDEGGIDDYTESMTANYKNFNYALRKGMDKFKDKELSDFLTDPSHSVFEILTTRTMEKTCNYKYDIPLNAKQAIRDCATELLNHPPIENFWDKGNVESIVDKYKSEIGEDIFDDAKEMLVDFGTRYLLVERMIDVIKTTIGYSAKSLEQPTILHRVTTVKALRDRLGIEDTDITLDAEFLQGRMIQDKGFTSTSKKLLSDHIYVEKSKLSDPDSDIYLEILAPAGTKGVSLGKISIYDNEQEVLLNPNDMFILNVEENFYSKKASSTIPKITVVLISKDISDYPTILHEEEKQPIEKDTQLETAIDTLNDIINQNETSPILAKKIDTFTTFKNDTPEYPSLEEAHDYVIVDEPEYPPVEKVIDIQKGIEPVL